MGFTKDQLLASLEELQIDVLCYDHPSVLTVEAQAKYVGHLGGALSKNLLLKDKKQRYYLVSAPAGTNIDLKVLSQRLGLGKGGLRMAPEEALLELLQVPLGCVTPFALINNSASTVSLLLDQGFKAHQSCYFHPLTNEVTICGSDAADVSCIRNIAEIVYLIPSTSKIILVQSIQTALSSTDLDKFLISIGRQPSYVDLEADPVVGKDNPPDLASFVPSGVPSLSDAISNPVTSVDPENNVLAAKKLTNLSGKDKSHAAFRKEKVEKVQSSADPLAEATDVEKLVNEIINKTSKTFLSEVNKITKDLSGPQIESSVLDIVSRRVSSDLGHMITTLKNAAYTQGFHAGFQATIRPSVQSLSIQK